MAGSIVMSRPPLCRAPPASPQSSKAPSPSRPPWPRPAPPAGHGRTSQTGVPARSASAQPAPTASPGPRSTRAAECPAEGSEIGSGRPKVDALTAGAAGQGWESGSLHPSVSCAQVSSRPLASSCFPPLSPAAAPAPHLAARQADAVELDQVRMAQHVQPLSLSTEGALAAQVSPHLHLLHAGRRGGMRHLLPHSPPRAQA